ncbi:MAG: beta-lactamase family protein [Candidatus Edwardsbacteria bacterium]|nr:beta-lactamase family protein [Candidatus Edwardsbacteria bacterium]
MALVDRDGIVWSEGFGKRSRSDRRPVDPQTLFSIQSVSKTITAAAVLLAARDGLVDLDAPITRYLPDFTVKSCFEDQPERRITLRLLLAHAAGLTHEPPVGNNFDCPFPSHEAHNRSIRDTWLNSPAGTRYSYSNCGYDLAAEAVAKASGMPFSEYLRRRLFLPLGMESTTLDPAVFIECGNRAVGHAFGLAELPEVMPFPGAGSVYASAGDLARFVQFHLNQGRAGGRQLLPQRLVLEMCRPTITPGYGLGVAIVDRNGKLVLNHNGGGFGWQASMTWYPTYGVGIVLLANEQSDADLYVLTLRILDDWIACSSIRPDTMTMPHDPVAIGGTLNSADARPPRCPGDTLFSESWRKYEGVYRLTFGAGFRFAWYARLARLLGYRTAKVELRRRGAGLGFRISHGGYGGWQRLTEHRPGLFFTEYGEALDLRADPPTYRNIKLER